VTQNVTVSVTSVPFLMVAVYDNGNTVQTGMLPANNVHGFIPTTSTPTTVSYTNTLAPRSTAWYPYCALFHHNPASCQAGDVHFTGGFNIDISVDTDQGSLTGVVQPRIEGSGCLTDTTNNIAPTRNTMSAFPINHGHAF
jgi:hypothetical protein